MAHQLHVKCAHPALAATSMPSLIPIALQDPSPTALSAGAMLATGAMAPSALFADYVIPWLACLTLARLEVKMILLYAWKSGYVTYLS